MRILFDQGTPHPLRRALSDHEIFTAFERGWSTLTNGELLDMAESEGFEVFVTTDSHLKNQQNLAERRIAIVVLLSTSWLRIEPVAPKIQTGIEAATPGSYQEIEIPSAMPEGALEPPRG